MGEVNPEQTSKHTSETLGQKTRNLMGKFGVRKKDLNSSKRTNLAEAVEVTDQKPKSEDETPRQKMIDVINKLASRRSELGVLGIGSDPKDPDKRIEIFISPINAIEDKSPEDGGDSDILIATTQGFFAIRFTGSPEGRDAAANLRANLSLWDKASSGTDKLAINDKFSLERAGKYNELVLKFNIFAPNFEFAERGRFARTFDDKSSVLVSKIVPVGIDSFNRALDASMEKARELKMPDTKSAFRIMETNTAADSALKRLENL